jgi:hypothetical protein
MFLLLFVFLLITTFFQFCLIYVSYFISNSFTLSDALCTSLHCEEIHFYLIFSTHIPIQLYHIGQILLIIVMSTFLVFNFIPHYFSSTVSISAVHQVLLMTWHFPRAVRT